MYARRIIGRNQRWGSVFQPSKYLIRPNCQDHTCSRSLNGTTPVGNRSPHGSSTRGYLLDSYSSHAVAPGNSYTGLHGWAATSLKNNNQLRVYSSASVYHHRAKPKEEDTSETRLNDQIKAQFVRLVTEEGHKVVSRYEALERARKLKLDLVEVQRNADPPVCKLMDFNREKYKKQVMDKDRAKAKSEVTLRKGDCKEVRLSGKIEEKDLKMKADTVIRLMERGYRVKCMILPKGKDEYVEELLSRFKALIEDVIVVESGPVIVEKKQEKKPGKKHGKKHEEIDEEEHEEKKREIKNAYMIVRHVKFGALKKGGAKKMKLVGNTGPEVEKVATELRFVEPFCEEDPAEAGLETEDEILPDEVELPIPPQMEMQDTTIEGQKTAWSVLDSSDDFKEVFDFIDDAKVATSNSTNVEMNAAPETVDFLRLKPVLDSTRADTFPSSPPEPSLGTENRYKRSEPRSQFIPTKSVDNRGPDMRDPARSESQFPNQRRQPPSNVNVSPSTGEMKQFENAPVFRNLNHPPNGRPKQEPSRPDAPGTTAPSYGIFSAPKTNAPENAPVFRNSNLPPNGRPKQEPSRPDAPSRPAPSYGIFSTPKTNGPGNQGVAADDAHRNREENLYNSSRNHGTPGVGANQNFQRPGVDNGGQGRWGIFGREGSNVTTNRISKTN